MTFEDTVILLFAKAPVEGQVNTRLIPDIGKQAATQLQHELIEQRLSILTGSSLAAVELHCLPNTSHQCFLEAEQSYPLTLLNQVGDDLGERMCNALTVALQKYRFCILLGTDAPALDAEAIAMAIAHLRAGDPVVFVPAEDGGYVLLGLSEVHRFLFEGISWGSENVMQQSRHALVANGVDYRELDTCWDIDRVEDYQRYQKFKAGC